MAKAAVLANELVDQGVQDAEAVAQLRADSREGQGQILAPLRKALKRLVDPDSGRIDPVLVSAAAKRAAWQHLRVATQMDPRTWPRN